MRKLNINKTPAQILSILRSNDGVITSNAGRVSTIIKRELVRVYGSDVTSQTITQAMIALESRKLITRRTGPRHTYEIRLVSKRRATTAVTKKRATPAAVAPSFTTNASNASIANETINGLINYHLRSLRTLVELQDKLALTNAINATRTVTTVNTQITNLADDSLSRLLAGGIA
jgi:DNA-binding transcriptional MocR family regulator